MKAILLAAGFGTRLGKLGKYTPKCLVDVHGRPLLDLWLDKLSEAGVSEFLINTHHLSFKVEEFISNHPLRNKILIKYEKELLGTAGTLRENKDFIDQDTFVLHADNYFEGDLNLFVQAHKSRPKECSMSMLTFIAKNPKNCGVVQTNSRNILVSFHEKVNKPPSNIANGAVYILTKKWSSDFDCLLNTAQDISYDILPNMVNSAFCYFTERTFVDIGTPESLAFVQGILTKNGSQGLKV